MKTHKTMTIEELKIKAEKLAGVTPKPVSEQLEDIYKKLT